MADEIIIDDNGAAEGGGGLQIIGRRYYDLYRLAQADPFERNAKIKPEPFLVWVYSPVTGRKLGVDSSILEEFSVVATNRNEPHLQYSIEGRWSGDDESLILTPSRQMTKGPDYNRYYLGAELDITEISVSFGGTKVVLNGKNYLAVVAK